MGVCKSDYNILKKKVRVLDATLTNITHEKNKKVSSNYQIASHVVLRQRASHLICEEFNSAGAQ